MDLPNYAGYASKIPESLMLLHGVVIFLGFFVIKAFLIEWLDCGVFDMDDRLRSVDTDKFPTQQIFLATNEFCQHLP